MFPSISSGVASRGVEARVAAEPGGEPDLLCERILQLDRQFREWMRREWGHLRRQGWDIGVGPRGGEGSRKGGVAGGRFARDLRGVRLASC